MKCFDPSCCSHDFPAFLLYLDRSSLMSSVSVKHIRGSIPFQYMNLFPVIYESLSCQREKSPTITYYMPTEFSYIRTEYITYLITVSLRPSEEMWQEAADDVVADEVHVFGGVFGNEAGHVHDVPG